MAPVRNRENVSDHLITSWEQFVQAKSSTNEVKTQWTEIFLIELLTAYKNRTDDNFNELLLSFCVPSLAGTLISCELLTDVHQLCQQQPGGANDDTRPLQRYLLQGRGTKCLLALNLLGTQGISCGRELAGLLVSLYPICLHDPIKSAEASQTCPFLVDEQPVEFEAVFNYKQSHSQKNWTTGSMQARHSTASSTASSSARFRRKRSSCGSFQQPSASSDSDNDFQDKDGDSPVIAPTLRIHLNPMDFDYFTSVVRSDDELERTKSAKKSVDPNDFYSDETKAAENAELSSFQFCQLLIDLIRKLCLSEPMDSNNQTSVQAIGFALEHLCSVQFGAVSYGAKDLDYDIKRSLAGLLVTAFSRVASAHESSSTIMHNGTIPLLVRVLEDAVRKSVGEEALDESNLTKSRDFIYGCIHAILCLFYSTIQQHERSKEFVEIFRPFSDSLGGRLFENIVALFLTSERQVDIGRAKKLISLVGLLIAMLKKVRSDFVHSHLCKRPRHKQCITAERHHHHDLMGQSYNPLSSSCCITTLFMVLTRVAQNCGDFEVEMRALKVMTHCGSCCCQPPRALLLPMLELVSRNNFKLSSVALGLLEKVLYSELGSSAGISTSCSICGSKMLQLLLSPAGFSTDNSSTSTLQESAVSLLEESTMSNWSCLESYRDLLESQDLQICFIIIEHLFKVIPNTSNVVKRELLFKVFFPTFLSQKNKYLEDPDDEVGQFLLTCCLSVFSSQLCNVAFAEEFINRGGLDNILELITIPTFSKLCCSILEVTIIIELWRNTNEPSEDRGNLSSLDMLQTSLENSTGILINSLQKISLKQQKRDRFMHGSIESDSGCPTETTDSSEAQGNDIPTPNRKQFLQQISSAAIFWRSCASLTACSPEFRYHLANHELATQATKLLHLIVTQAVRGPSEEDDFHKGSEFYFVVRLLEALVTVCLGISNSINSNSSASDGDEQDVLSSIRQAILVLKPRGRTHVQAICDMLLRCAATHFFDQQVLPARSKPELPTLPPILLDLTPPPTNNADSEEAEGSSIDNSYLTADEGYEADIEVAEYLSEVTEDTAMNIESRLSLSFILPQQSVKSNSFSKPELCCLVVSLLVQLHENSEDELNPSLVHALQKLTSVCRDSPQNCITLTNHGVIASLLSGFSKCLKVRDPDKAELQQVILELVSILARYSITPKELSLYLSFFKSEEPPCDILLAPLTNLAAQTRPQPHFILCFPAESDCSVHEIPAMAKEAERLSYDMHSKHIKLGLNSSWASTAVALPLNMSVGWAMWTQGFSAALWLRTECAVVEIPVISATPRNSNASCTSGSLISDWNNALFAGSSRSSLTDSMKSAQSIQSLVHLFSLGGESLTLEFWADAASELLCLRLCRCDNNYEILAETVINHFLPKGNWHHLAVNVRDFMQHKKTIVEVTLFLDGWKEMTVHLRFTGLLVRKSRPTCLLLGHVASSVNRQIGRWYFGGLMLFRNSVFTRERAMYMAGLGPNITNLTECEANKPKPNFSQLFNSKTVNCGLNWDLVLEGPCSNLKAMQENLLLTYSAQNCQVVHIYPQVVTNATGSLFPPTASGFRVVATEQRASQQVPLTASPVFLVSPNKTFEPQQFKGLAAASSLLGGIQVFLVLFARVVELGGSETEQAQAVSLLLRLAQGEAELFTQLSECHKLLLQVLESPQCKAGPHVLKSCLDACTDRSLMPLQLPGGDIAVSHISDAIVINSFLLATTVKAWRAWDSSALSCLFRSLHALLRDDHPFREFNAAQMNRVRLVETLLMFCKEKFLYEEKEDCKAPMPPDVSCSVVELVRSLMGAPPEFSHIVAVADFLLLVHRASATYVSHARSNFYFLLATDDFNKQFALELERKRAKNESYQPVDPSKLNKALANLQIKQNDMDSDGELDSNRFVEEQQQFISDQNSSEDMADMSSIGFSNDSGLSFYPNMPEDEEGRISALKNNKSNWEKFNAEAGLKENDIEGEKANCQFIVVEGLLLLLRDTILVLPDSMSQQVLNHVVRPDMLLAMANHADSRVRTAVVRVLSAYLQRATDEEINKFLKMKGFYLLANQLSQFEATAELVEACIALITRCQVSLEEQTELWSLKDMTPLQFASFPPLLSLLPRSVCDTALCHNIVFFLREILTKVQNSYKGLLECGLLETMGHTLLAVAHLSPDHSDLCGVSEQDLIIGDIFVFFVTIIGRAIGQPGSTNLQVILDLLLQIGYLEKQERLRCGWPSRCAQTMRDAQSAVLEGALERLQERGSSACMSATSSKTRNSATILASMLSASNDDLPTAFGTVSAQQVLTLSGQLKDVPRGEINERFKLLIQKSVEFLTGVEPLNGVYKVSESENGFARSLLVLLIRALASTLEKQPRPAARTAWQGAVWAARDTIRVLLGQLAGFMMSPRQPVRIRMFVVATLHGEIKCREVLTTLLQLNTQVEHRFSVFLRDLLMPHRGLPLTSSDIKVCETLISKMTTWGVISVKNTPSDPVLWSEELALFHEEIDRLRQTSGKQQEISQRRAVTKLEEMAKAVAESAMVTTRAAVEAQNAERKAFMEHIKASTSESVHLRAQWHSIVQQLTHEKAVWFFPESYPGSWQLDPTEGPSRVRKRLQRCHLGIKDRYFMPEFRQKLESVDKPSTLSFLFDIDGKGSSSVLIERLHTNEKIRYMTTVQVVTPAQEVSGEMLVGETCLYFVSDDIDATLEVSSMAWQFEDVREIHQRRFQLQERAVEIFLANGRTYLLALQSSKQRDEFLQVISQCLFPNLLPAENLNSIMQLWRDGLLSNFEYLIQLNKMAGRSFNDLMQYPVFPFVLSDYVSPRLDLASTTIYRNFEKPMAVQDKKNEQHYIDTYNYLKQELQGGLSTISLNHEPFHYGSHYSNSGTILHFLVRMPPFTKMFLSYQDNNFDIPDRTFHALKTTWRLTSSDSTTDVKELIPEFFFLPEFLLNSEGFSLGIRQNGERVNHVQLPPWCEGSPRSFILAHRQALESDYVRENLPHWIDLVFGCKQTGKAAVDAINVFHPATYIGFDVTSIKDPLERLAWETMVRTYGQTPRQLFKAPHPMIVQSLSSKDSKKGNFSFTPPFNGAVQSLRWGSYVGSPAEGEPKVAWKHTHRTPVSGLVPLRSNDVFGLAPCTSLLLAHQGGRGSLLGTPNVLGAALISWGHSDGVIRAKMRKEQPPVPLIQTPCLDPVVMCASTPDLPQLWISLSSGRILVMRFNFQPAKSQLDPKKEMVQLLGHQGPVLSLALCTAYSVAVSGSQDGSAIIWDLNTLSYVRTIENFGGPVQKVAVSDVSGDIVLSGPQTTLVDTKPGSVLRLYTVNARLVGSISCEEQITALCFSCAQEGLAVNAVAAGLASGEIRLWNAWDLAPLRKITSEYINTSIIDLVFSFDAQHLYATAMDGTVVIWEASGTRGKTAKFLNLTSL
ncbi:lysosomal-trafficking regulator isoform X2 [Neocloeon triangulifer]|uniref:lysosomal-trafficking regulator isoform X2 n=1 Tax=Neocloeon triangulifer TaxID=2078957 RepID=UPI00286F38DA|nr:lysosomal-trafficking regulator isoform X2 [Neocloeon triangulifer]